MQSEDIVFVNVSQHRLLTEFYLESELEISEDWTKTSGVFLSEAIFIANNNDIADTNCTSPNKNSLINKCDIRINHDFKSSAQGSKMIGAYSLSRRFGVTVLDYIAVKQDARQNGLGSVILSRIKEKCKELGVEKIYLTAKARGFFLKNGAKDIPDTLPLYGKLLGDCAECPQREKDCFPSVMEIEI